MRGMMTPCQDLENTARDHIDKAENMAAAIRLFLKL
jgi:hypothetical protein